MATKVLDIVHPLKIAIMAVYEAPKFTKVTQSETLDTPHK